MSHCLRIALFSLALSIAPSVFGQTTGYTFFVRQVQMPAEAGWDITVSQQGSQLSPLAINPYGARFELWAVKSSPLTSYLLDTTYVNSYVPVASVQIQTEDPYTLIPRTRADRPYYVSITVSGLSSDPMAPDAAKSVKMLRHAQAYPANGDGSNLNRSLATLVSQGSISQNGFQVLQYTVNAVPGPDRTKVRGEERFSVFSLADYGAPESQLNSQFVQIWPMSEASVTGLNSSSVVKGTAPDVTITLTDLYPDSVTHAQVYPGPPVLDTAGTTVPGASLVISGTVPRNEQIFLKNWDEAIPNDGQWTLEVLTTTAFGVDRLAYTTFTVDRAIKVNGAVTSAD
jgi:hypothetical protein